MVSIMAQRQVEQELRVGIADWKVAKTPVSIITLGLGSCVGVTLYDYVQKIGGMVHIMLPDSTQFSKVTNPAKYADTGIKLLLNKMLAAGARKKNLQAKLVGGAQMFRTHQGDSNLLNIGQRNVEMCRQVLAELDIDIISADTGGNYGRTMILDTRDGTVRVRTVGRHMKVI